MYCMAPLNYTLLGDTALHCTALQCTEVHCTALHCTALGCVTGRVSFLAESKSVMLRCSLLGVGGGGDTLESSNWRQETHNFT